MMENYEAYVYEIKITKIDGIYYYIGWHAGLVNGHYFNSSENQQLKEDWRNYPDSREYNIIKTGTRYDMAYLEYQMLTKVDARNNPFYYNKSNGGGKYLKKHGDVNMIYQVHDDVVNRKFLGAPIELDELNKLYFFQIRQKVIYRDHAALLGQKISDKQGDMSDWAPLLIFKDMVGPNGEPHTVGQGNHTTLGANQAAKDYSITPIPTQWVDKKVWSKFDEDDLESLLLLLNPLDEKPSLSTDEDRSVAWIVKQYKKKKVPVTAQSNLEYLLKMNWTKKKIEQGLMVKAKEKIDNDELIPDGMIIVDYKSGDDKRYLDELIATWKKKGFGVVACSSGKFKWDTLIEHVMLSDKKLDKFIIIVYHTSLKTQTQWDEYYGQQIGDSLRLLGEKMGNKNMFRTPQVLPFLKENPLFATNPLLEELEDE